MLHDIGMAVDYDDHHRHSRYLVLNGGLPGFAPAEVALVAQAVRYHRKGTPGFDDLAGLARPGDHARLERIATLVRLAEDLERARDQSVRRARVEVADGTVRLALEAEGDVGVARWAVEREVELFRRAFGRDLVVLG
jgi:exopolyphosphatase/guanosine-5'-triphosphate,3'-diphosphate pyrophosphatase